MRLLVFCEAAADFRVTAGLVDRLCREEGPAWIADLLDTYPDAVRVWIGETPQHAFFDLHRMDDHARRFGVRRLYGHFDSKPGAPGAMMARDAFLVARALAKRSEPVDAVLLVWDMDDQGEERRAGLAQAYTEAAQWASFRIVLGCPDPMREAWVLAGFEPESAEERVRLDELRRELGFSPCDESHRLGAKDEQAKRNPKRVLDELLAKDEEREERCWTAAPLALLRARGQSNGLAQFVDDVVKRIVPLLAKPASAP